MTSTRPAVDHERSSLARLSVGVAQSDITPPIGISSNPWGKSTTAISTGVHRPLMAVALCISGQSDRFIVTLDLGWIGCHECDVVNFRGRVVKELGITLDDLLVNLSQTHKGPPMCVHEALREGKEFVPDFIEKVISTVIELCKKARTEVAIADITWAYGKCDLGTVRDLPIGDTDFVGYNPELTPDHTVAVGRITNLSGKHVATLVNYGCHPTSVGWDSSLISPDYIGRARELVEDSTGAPMLFLLGACGNVAPRRQYSGDVSVADRNGEMLGYSTLATLSRMLPPATELAFTEVIKSGSNLAGWEPRAVAPNTTVVATRVHAVLKHKPLLDESQMRELWTTMTATEEFLESRIRKQFEMRIDYVMPGGVVHHPVWFWQLGDALVIAHCGEAYLEMARELRRRHPEVVILFLDMTNGPGYIYVPTRSAYERNAYQSSQTLLAPGGFEDLLEIIDEHIIKLGL
ncbi:unannotated protein [freshwater metagenome]|uniref:Unannotated protein n=1 Tax=freshwater metagenome TaxID=449393 RepID=A0A6J7QR56_9ZZZZ|nr:hypothetical protein [Actinomycetota bacterium]MSY40285.1 hypothetical protein [Actinomycetota bacterium]